MSQNFAVNTINLSGDVIGTSTVTNVISVNGVAFPANPPVNSIPVVMGTNSITYQSITDAQINASAAIAGTKISPNFGSQAVSTAGSLASGALTVTGSITQSTGAISLTANGASSFTTSSGPLTLTATGASTWSCAAALTISSGAAATWSTSSGALTVDSAAALNLGTSAATSVSISRSGEVTTINGTLTVTGAVTLSNLTKGVVLSSSVGLLSQANGTAGQFLIESTGTTATWTTISGDATASTGTPGALTVVALQGNAVQSGALSSASDGYALTWHNASSQWQALPISASTATTQPVLDNSTKIATTAYVDQWVNGGVAHFEEDCFYVQNVTVSGVLALMMDCAWSCAPISGGSSGTIIMATADSQTNPGQALINTPASTGQGIAIYRGSLGGNQGPFGTLGSFAGWQFDIWIILPSTITSYCVRAGYCSAGQQATDPPTAGAWIEYDTSNTGNSNTKWTFRTVKSSTSTYDTTANVTPTGGNASHFRIYSTVAGTITYQIGDNNGALGVATGISTNVDTTSRMMPFLQILPRAGINVTVTLDRFTYRSSTGRV